MAAAGTAHIGPGVMIKQWNVEKKLGEGGFGAVYRVSNGNHHYALKIESQVEEMQRLCMEVLVLNELTKGGGRHFCRIEDKGHYGHFNYVVMTLAGKSLQDLRKAAKDGHFSMGTAIGAGIQCLEALEDLHSIGYLHRDVKPGNYTVGRIEHNELRKIYLLDFGMCRKYTNSKNIIRKPRQNAAFRGTLRYAPLSCHIERELCRRDDVESWLYMQVELTTNNIPWKNLDDMFQVGEYKKQCRHQPRLYELFGGCPSQFVEILRYTDSLRYYDAPDYQYIYRLMRRILDTMHVKEFPYDWENQKKDDTN
ncbi:hypothetical protein AB6A40_001077 [Gnathostoma spinigerum]|uniref:non-specific serine/threonine protein kinase n=1 Tax=Gnathostoma spinigerum TaxID=75299 RepID=A0ABD6EC39_9BILA